MSSPARPVQGDADYLFADLLAAEDWHFWFRARQQLVLWALGRFVSLRTGSLLEVGCGTGFVLKEVRRRYPALGVWACDASRDAIKYAAGRVSGARFFQADVQCLPLSHRFDAVLALDVIEHVDDDGRALVELFRILRPGGSLLLTVPQHDWLWSRIDEFSHHRRRYDRRDLISKVRAAGFRVRLCTSFFCATLPFAILSRRMRADAFDPAAELRLSRTANALMRMLLVPESLLVRAGMSLPAGSTLLLVASRPPA